MNRIDDTKLIDYIHHALSDSDKRQVEAALRDDAALRQHVSDLRALQTDIKRSLSAEINAQAPSHNMSYAAIAQTVRSNRPKGRYGRQWQWVSRLVGIAALFVLGFAFMYSLSDRDPIQEGGLQVVTPTAIITATVEPALLPYKPSETPTPISGDRTVPMRTPVPDAQPDVQEDSSYNLDDALSLDSG